MNRNLRCEARVPAYTDHMPPEMAAELRPMFPDAKVIAKLGSHEIRQCDVEGCLNLVMDDTRCRDCREELAALDCWAIQRELKRQERAERREQIRKSSLEICFIVWDWLKANAVDYALLLFVAWSVGYIVNAYSDMWVQWLIDLAGR